MGLHISKESNKKDTQYIDHELYKINLKAFSSRFRRQTKKLAYFLKTITALSVGISLKCVGIG